MSMLGYKGKFRIGDVVDIVRKEISYAGGKKTIFDARLLSETGSFEVVGVSNCATLDVPYENPRYYLLDEPCAVLKSRDNLHVLCVPESLLEYASASVSDMQAQRYS